MIFRVAVEAKPPCEQARRIQRMFFFEPFVGYPAIPNSPVHRINVGIENHVIKCHTTIARQARMAS
jgi:hypothetical protein